MPLKLIPSTPKKSLNAAFLKVRPLRSEIDAFKANLIQLLDKVDESEREENQKNHIRDFLVNTYYSGKREVNTKGTIDLVIHTDNSNKSSVGVIIEAKRPSNKSEWISADKPNGKALQECVLYYMRERVDAHNIDIKHIILTNIYEWYVIDAAVFDRLFYQNKKFVKAYESWRDGQKVTSDTALFYTEIARPYLDEIHDEIPCTYFDIRSYEKELRNADKDDDNKLIELYKLLSEYHLLNVPFANDSNSLDKRFYTELLHIIGLTETKEGSKKLIGRHKEGERHSGTILEDAIIQIDAVDKLHRIGNVSQYGSTKEERLFNIALELSITWINRILFLKLLEGQLVAYHRGDKNYLFLNNKTIKEYDDLNTIFFQVLAKKHEERNSDVKTTFARVPYLNSSLFEPTELEHETILISNLRDEKTMPIHSQTVLKDANGQRRTGTISALEYLFAFLDAYDFASEGSGDIQEDNKTLINASVLGLIFEKINGYKDGSFFTPGFITMYMCKETIRRAVVQKFNESKGWSCNDITDLYNKIEDRNEANTIVNSIKICDPAVGSGHFLVSALNEMIAIKSDLHILQDKDGRLLRGYKVEVVNDELSIRDEEGDLYAYNPRNTESQRVQETLFHEKETIIESCLFGVDINPNSVKICRLRLWIELLKNAYYKSPDVLETLPNIDINIKCGNSLVSRYALDVDIKDILKSANDWNITTYRWAVDRYRNASNKDEKREMESFIEKIKGDFKSEVDKPFKKKISEARGKAEKYAIEITNLTAFGQKIDKKLLKDHEDAVAQLTKFESEREDIISNKIYENAFEWRFEFPEVLNDEGDFVGFDVVIGNPPYIRQEELTEIKPYLESKYDSFVGTADMFIYFIELGIKNLKQNGNFTFIVPNKWMKAGYGKKIRGLIKLNKIAAIIDFGDLPVFEEATTYPSILSISKNVSSANFDATSITTLNFQDGLNNFISENKIEVLVDELNDEGWTLNDSISQKVLHKIRQSGVLLGEFVSKKMYRGILTGFNEAFIIDKNIRAALIEKDPNCSDLIKPFLDGKDIKSYQTPKSKKWLIFTRRGININNYPSIFEHLNLYKDDLTPKIKDSNSLKGRKPGSYKWFEIQDSVDYHSEFEKDKIVWAETSLGNQFCLIEAGIYLNKTTFMIPINDMALLGILNSKVVKFYLDSIVSKVRGGYFSMSKSYVETVPIVYPQNTTPFIEIVKEIIDIKKQNSAANTTDLEAQIDQLVYELYGLTEKEIRIVEGNKNGNI